MRIARRPSRRAGRLLVLASTSLLAGQAAGIASAQNPTPTSLTTAGASGTGGAAVPADDRSVDADDRVAASGSEIVVEGSNRPSGIGSPEQARLEQKLAPNIVEVQSQVEIKQLPNYVLGDAARRLPGASVINKSGESRSLQIRGIDPNLNGITFEGVLLPAGSINAAGRALPLDAIPAALAGGLELVKTNTPAQEATALGGQLNILSRDIAVGEKPFLEVIAAGGFRQPHPTELFQGTVSGGLRFGPGDRKPFAFSFFATDLVDALHLDDLQQTFADKAGVPPNTLTRGQRIEYVQTKKRRGYGGTASWDIDDANRVYFKGFASGIDFHPIRHQLIFDYSAPQFNQANPAVYTATAKLSEAVNDNLVHDDERLYKFGGTSRFGRVSIDYYGAYASNRLDSPYSYSGTLTRPGSSTVLVDNATTPLLPLMQPTDGTDATNFSAYRLSALSNASQDDRDGQWSGHLGLSAPLELGPVNGTVSAGGGLRLERITHDDRTFTYGGLPALTGSDLPGTTSYSIFDGAYDLGSPVSQGPVRSLIDGGTLVENSAADAMTNSRAALDDDEHVYDGYLQYSGNWGRLGLLAGVRYEATRGVYRGTAAAIVGGMTTLTPRAVRQDYGNFFPTAQLRYAFTDDLIGRANFSTAIGRPGFSQITATQTVNFGTGLVTQGNPDLKPITGRNYDASLEYYLPQGGILSLGGFDKEFSNYIVATTTMGTFTGIQGTATFATYANIPTASARGFEFNYRQQFTFLPGMLSGFGLGANFTYVASRGARRAGVVETLANTTPRIANVEAFYKRGPMSLQLFGNYQSRTLTSLGATPALDNYVQPYLNFDVDARYPVTKRLSVFFQGRNVTRENQIATEGKPRSRFVELQYFGSSYLFGIDLRI